MSDLSDFDLSAEHRTMLESLACLYRISPDQLLVQLCDELISEGKHMRMEGVTTVTPALRRRIVKNVRARLMRFADEAAKPVPRR